MDGYTTGQQWTHGERTFHAFARRSAGDDGHVSYVPAVRTVIRDAPGPIVEANLERFHDEQAALARAKRFLQEYFGLDETA